MKHLTEKDLLSLASKLIINIPDPRNAEEYYQSFIIKKIIKSIKQSEIINYQPKTFQNPNIVDIKSVITKHPQTSGKLSKTIRKVEKVDSSEKVLNENM